MGWFKRNKAKTEAWYRKELDVPYSFANPEDDVVSEMLKSCIGYGIRSLDTRESHYISILFKNDISFRFWNSNRYYAWMMQGSFKDEQTEKDIYSYKDGRASAELMWILKKQIAKYYGEIISERDNIEIFNALQRHESIQMVKKGDVRTGNDVTVKSR